MKPLERERAPNSVAAATLKDDVWWLARIGFHVAQWRASGSSPAAAIGQRRVWVECWSRLRRQRQSRGTRAEERDFMIRVMVEESERVVNWDWGKRMMNELVYISVSSSGCY